MSWFYSGVFFSTQRSSAMRMVQRFFNMLLNSSWSSRAAGRDSCVSLTSVRDSSSTHSRHMIRPSKHWPWTPLRTSLSPAQLKGTWRYIFLEWHALPQSSHVAAMWIFRLKASHLILIKKNLTEFKVSPNDKLNDRFVSPQVSAEISSSSSASVIFSKGSENCKLASNSLPFISI